MSIDRKTNIQNFLMILFALSFVGIIVSTLLHRFVEHSFDDISFVLLAFFFMFVALISIIIQVILIFIPDKY